MSFMSTAVLFTAITQFLDIDQLLSALVQLPKQETVQYLSVFTCMCVAHFILELKSLIWWCCFVLFVF